MSERAAWARAILYLGWTSLILLLAGPLLTRVGLLPFTIGLLLVAVAALATLIVALAAMLMINPRLAAGNRRALGIASVLALPGLVFIASAGMNAGGPVIHNISTDTVDPPQFQAAQALRGKDSNPLDYDAETAALQREAYPDVTPILSPLPPPDAHRLALNVAEAMGWTVYEDMPQEGRIEAVDTTFWFGFKDDIVIRVRAEGEGSRIDLRSVSRVGRGDLGANAKRIRTFRELFLAES